MLQNTNKLNGIGVREESIFHTINQQTRSIHNIHYTQIHTNTHKYAQIHTNSVPNKNNEHCITWKFQHARTIYFATLREIRVRMATKVLWGDGARVRELVSKTNGKSS